MLRIFIIFVFLFSLTSCVDYLDDETPKDSEQSRAKAMLIDGVWQKYTLLDNYLNPDITTIQTHRLTFNHDGTFESTSHFTSRANAELPDNITIYKIDPITSIGQYTLGKSIITESGLTAISIDLDWKIDDNETDITLDIAYIGGAKLYLGLPRKLPSCEGIQEPYYEFSNFATLEETETSDASDLAEFTLEDTTIGHTINCYGRPNALDFEQPYIHMLVITGELELTLDNISPIEFNTVVIEPSEGETTTGEIDIPEPSDNDIPTLEIDPSILNPPLGTYRI